MADYSGKFDFSLSRKGAVPSAEVVPAPEAGAQEEPKPDGTASAVPSDSAGPVLGGEPCCSGPVGEAPRDDVDKAPGGKRVRRSAAPSAPADRLCRVNIPKNVVDMVQAMVPSAPTKPLAVLTYLYVTLGRPPGFPDEVVELGCQYQDDGGVGDLQQQVLDMADELKKTQQAIGGLSRQASETGMALLWLVAEKLGYNVSVTAMPENIEFLFGELPAMKRRLAGQAAELRNRESAERGREMNSPHYRPPSGCRG